MLRFIVLMLVGILLSVTMIGAVNTKHYADAMKADDFPVTRNLGNKYSMWVGNKVCGNEKCQGHSYFKWNMKYRTYVSPYDNYDNPALLKIKKQK